ncbi:MAG: class I adenylate-forming enzyme family protein [bacterium]|nr:class I adenylate-forming enzyme family protein [bacterium]
MKFREEIKKSGNIPTYLPQNLLDELIKIDNNKPSSRLLRTKYGKKSIAALTEIEEKHNHSWYKELKQRSKTSPNAVALFYRGTTITFDEMFKKADTIAKSLSELGIKSGDEIPVCLSNTPELVYIMLAANKIGAKLNLFGAHFDKAYLENILSKCTSTIFIGTDDTYAMIKETIEKAEFKNKVLISLTDSLPKEPEKCYGYEPTLDKYYHFQNKAADFIKENPDIISYSDFESIGEKSKIEIIDNNNLNTDFIVTYTSGSTKIGKPKQIRHTNRSFITIGIFHDPELCGNPKMPGFRSLAHIHSESNTNLITSISDALMQQWSVAMEPEYSKEKALDYLIINKPNQANLTTSFWIAAAKQYLIEKKHHEDGTGEKLPFLFAPLAVGEKKSAGEEKFINEFLREAKAGSGVKIKGISLPYVTIGDGGGDCEHGGIYYTLWRTLYQNVYSLPLGGKEYGMKPVPFAHIGVFKEKDAGIYEECDYGEYGIVAANSPVTMTGYKDDPKATEDLVISDTDGRDWISSNVYGCIDKLGSVHVKGRVGNTITLNDETKIPAFIIEDIAEKDTKNILSCAIVNAKDEAGEDNIVINVEFQPNRRQKNDSAILSSLKQRCEKKIPQLSEIESKIYYRIISNEESYPLTGSGKRNIRALEEMGLENTLRIINSESKDKSEEKKYIKKLV